MTDQNIHAAEEHAHEEHEGMSRRKIWQVFGILLAITIVEFIIALWVLPGKHLSHGVGNCIYIVLTLLKAFYIVAYFMHLKFERVAFKTTIVAVLVLVIYFIILLLTEGTYLHVHMN